MGLANAKPNRASLAALGLSDGENLLELGCGPGHALQVLLRDPHLERAIGLDWSETMLAQAARRNRRSLETGRLALVRGDFASLPFDDGSADAVLAVNVVYFMSATAVGEARRVLRGGGRLVIYGPLPDATRIGCSIARDWQLCWPRPASREIASVSTTSMRALASAACSRWRPRTTRRRVSRSAAPKRTMISTTTADRVVVARSRAAPGTRVVQNISYLDLRFVGSRDPGSVAAPRGFQRFREIVAHALVQHLR
jgi:SAM-dependent methyltransferase